MLSFDQINYAIRPNKNVERKMMAECLNALRPRFDINSYQYVGFGSMWFSDFVLFHKYLGVDDMVSIEKETSREDRARFNLPYGCVKLVIGESSSVLPQMDWSAKRSIVWLDYDGGLDESVLSDASLLCQRVRDGSVVAITVAADRRLLEIDGDNSEEGRISVLRQIVGDLAPDPLPKGAVTSKGLPPLISSILITHLQRATRVAARSLKFVPLFNFFYSDNAPMVTVGGMIVDAAGEQSLADLALHKRYEFLSGEVQYTIDVPHLTAREKVAFDRLLPMKKRPTVKTLGFTLRDNQIEAYSKLYRFYPLFSELLP
jgi:hypothetical protein